MYYIQKFLEQHDVALYVKVNSVEIESQLYKDVSNYGNDTYVSFFRCKNEGKPKKLPCKLKKHITSYFEKDFLYEEEELLEDNIKEKSKRIENVEQFSDVLFSYINQKGVRDITV